MRVMTLVCPSIYGIGGSIMLGETKTLLATEGSTGTRADIAVLSVDL